MLRTKFRWKAKGAAMKPVVLYLSMLPGNPSHERKLAGVRRYCAMRGWNAVPVPREEVSPETLPDILRRHRPVGCVVDGIGRPFDLPPRLFGALPVSYIGYKLGRTGRFPNFVFDADAIAQAALRELSAGKPSCYAAVGAQSWLPWARRRILAFRAAVSAAGAKCHVFPARKPPDRESWEDFLSPLTPWLASLPEHCAVFAVSDQTAVLVAEAARRALRHIPKSLTLLSVDNFTELCESAAPPISSIALDMEREGFLAARALGEGMGVVNDPILVPALMVVRRRSTSGSGRHEPWIMEAVDVIRREAAGGLTARDLIARFPASKTNFNRRFREAVGHSVLDEILHVRLEKACTLLAQTDTAIGAIPGLCGFGCDRTLDALFRARFKMSMRDWRRQHSQRL